MSFFGLGSKYRPILHEQIFQLLYFSNGGFSHDDVYNMPVYLRIFYYKKLNEQHKKENAEMEKSKKGGGSSPKGINIPSFAKSPKS